MSFVPYHTIIFIITIIISIKIIIMIISKHEEIALDFTLDVFIIQRFVTSKFPDFSLTFA